MRTITTVVSAVLVIVAGIALIPIREIAGDPNSAEGPPSSVAFAAPFIAAGLVALLGEYRAKPIYSVAAGVALLPISLVSFILIPLLIPAILLIGMGLSRFSAPSNLEIGVSIFIAVGLIAAFASLLVHQDPATYSTPNGSGGSSDIVTTTEATLSLTIVAAVLVVAALVGRHPGASRPAAHT